jgi:hypothetical protein
MGLEIPSVFALGIVLRILMPRKNPNSSREGMVIGLVVPSLHFRQVLEMVAQWSNNLQI